MGGKLTKSILLENHRVCEHHICIIRNLNISAYHESDQKLIASNIHRIAHQVVEIPENGFTESAQVMRQDRENTFREFT